MPRIVKPSKKRQNEIDRLRKLAEKSGINFDALIQEVPLTDMGVEAVERAQIEAESVLFYIETKGKDFKQKICKWEECKGLFLHTYEAVAYCSDSCRANALAEMGLIWNYHRRSDRDRWNAKGKGYLPKVIGAAATEALIEAGHFYVDED